MLLDEPEMPRSSQPTTLTTHHTTTTTTGSPALDPEDYPTAVCDNWWAVDDATPTIKDFVERTPELSTLVAALNAVNMTDLLRFVGPIILFAPNNEAFESLLASSGPRPRTSSPSLICSRGSPSTTWS